METRSNHVLVGAVVLAMLAGLLLFTVWLAGLSNKKTRCFDIYFAQAVGGLNKGSAVSFSGVPVGTIEQISLLPDRPEFVWVRINVDDETPVLQGTTAEIKGVGFTGVSEIQLSGAVKGGRPITQPGPQGCPVLPSSASGLGALLNSAPELIDRIQRLTERLTELLSDKNQNSISDILENVEKTTDVLAARAPDLADAIGDARIAARNAGIAAQRVGILADSTTRLVNEEGRPAAQDLRRAIAGIEKASGNLDAMIADARPGVQNLTKSTLPEANRLVRDLRELTTSLRGFTERLDQEGIGGALGPQKLPDYKAPRTRR
jgi:phospholipid/cholesterol/gamma-HCH transport system substrate-binding protein